MQKKVMHVAGRIVVIKKYEEKNNRALHRQ